MQRAAAALSLLLVGAAPAPESQGIITSMEVRFFDPAKGEFTANQLNKDGRYAGWNTFMNEGNGGYARGDALVVVKLALPNRDGRNFQIDGPLTLTARNKDKVIAERRFARIDFVTSKEVARVLHLEDIGCAGDILIEAELEGRSKTASLDLECGE